MNANISVKSKKRIQLGNIAILIALFGLTIGCWNEIEWYEVIAPLGTLMSTIALFVAFFCYVDIKEAVRDKEVYIMAIGDLVALTNLFVIGSNKGAFLTVTCLLMMLYMADKLVMHKTVVKIICVYLGFHYFYWTFDVKGYFKGYNTNYGGLVLITGFAFAMLCFTYIREKVRIKGNMKLYYALLVPYIFMFAWGYNIISWYRARCALLGLLVIAVLIALPKKLWNMKWMYNILTGAMTFGAIAVSGVYVWLGRMKDVFTIRIFYKDIISGREEIWSELWQAFSARPITGIGSSYEIKLDWMGGMFEVHNGFLDILIVHGIIVFGIAMYFMVRRLLSIREYAAKSEVCKVAMAGVMAVLASSFLENFFIVPPFTLCLMFLILIASGKTQEIS